MSRLWEDEEVEFLKENYKKKGAKYCSDLLNRKIYAIRKKANKLNISSKRRDIYKKENLEKIIIESYTYKEVLIKMGLRAAGGNYKVLKKYIELYKISISHFLTTEDLSKRNLNQKTKELEKILIENSTYSRSLLKERLYKERLKERKCELCEQGEEWMGKKMSLILDHINGIYNDNRIENLRIVCPNCNATLETHAGKNKKITSETNEDKKINKCECGEITRSSKKCKKCFSLNQRKVDRPSYEKLIKEIEKLGYVGVGKKYGVSDNAVRKWKKQYEKYRTVE
jgi:hypothetical protein